MKAEITGQGDELTITLDAAELPGVTPSDASMRAKLPEAAGGIASGILAMIGAPPEPGEAKTVRVVHVRLARSVTVAETTVMLAEPVECWP
ncbi:MAG TPA: hypothetical protein VK284_14630 [Streptosporangiaceae bacterium]|nr:hypothetical protein [Streptosporangiaceae bacterium]HLN70201.1 hypothetical protein [Streptosporangiaceae bacterium]